MSNPAQGMPCPVDGSALVMSERSGIEIDYCPTCRGVWLDRGELDKILERSAQQSPAATPQPQYQPQHQAPTPGYAPGQGHAAPSPVSALADAARAFTQGRGDQRHHDPRYADQRHYGQRKKPKSFLEELFD